MTTGGSITAEQRSFYTTFRRKLEDTSGGRSSAEIIDLLNQTRSDSEGKFSDGEFSEFVDAVLSKIEYIEPIEAVEPVEESEIHPEAEPVTELETVSTQETPSIHNHHPSKGILSRLQSLSVGILAIIGGATILSFVMSYFTM